MAKIKKEKPRKSKLQKLQKPAIAANETKPLPATRMSDDLIPKKVC